MNKVPAYRKVTSVLLALTVLLLSCGKQPQESTGTPVAFSSAWDEPATKTTSSLPSGTTFGVMAWYTGQDEWADVSASAIPNFMFNEDVTFTSPSTYTYSPIKYWPNNLDDKVSFWAYCPHDASGLTLKSGDDSYANTSTGIPSLNFNVLTGYGLVDLMVADFVSDDESLYWTVDHTKPSLDSPVHFLFRHLLSRVVFHFVKNGDDSDNFTVRLTDVHIEGIYNTATHPGDNDGGSAVWSGYDDLDDLVVHTDTTPTGAGTHRDVPKGAGTDLAVMPLPQALYGNDSAKIYISYVVIPSGGGDPSPEESGEFTIASLHPGWTESGDGWEKNTQYTYNVSITPGQNIEFSASIERWGEPVEWVYHHVD